MPTWAVNLKSLFLVILALGAVVACFGEDKEPEYAPVRPYAGLNVDTFIHEGVSYLYVSIQEGHPAANAGVEDGDLVMSLDGKGVETPQDVFALIEAHEPGEILNLELQRFVAPFSNDGSMPEAEPLSADVLLIEEPLPDASYIRMPSGHLRREDELRLGLLLSDITLPRAAFYGLDGPEGVVIELSPVPLSLAWETDIEMGDVLLAINNQRIGHLRDVQSIVDRVDEDEPVRLLVSKKGQKNEYVLDSLGPDVPGANQFPPDARRRLLDAIERGDLHPSRIETAVRQHFWREGADRPRTVVGAITELTSDSITVEAYSNGNEWSAAFGPTTEVAFGRSVEDLRIGEYVEVIDAGSIALLIVPLSEPLPGRP